MRYYAHFTGPQRTRALNCPKQSQSFNGVFCWASFKSKSSTRASKGNIEHAAGIGIEMQD